MTGIDWQTVVKAWIFALFLEVAASDWCASFAMSAYGHLTMKLKFVFAMMAAGGLFVAPVFADQHGDKKAAMEESAEGTVAAFVVAASGGG